jgi:hypothetical protein
MGPRQCAGRLPMTNRDRQADESLRLDRAGKIADDRAYPGSLPNRCFVVISQMEAAPTKIGSTSSSKASRALTLSLSSPASHQRKACVSGRSRATLLPIRQLGARQWLEKIPARR